MTPRRPLAILAPSCGHRPTPALAPPPCHPTLAPGSPANRPPLHRPRADIVRLYDLDESGALTVDEVTLALKGALSGVAKLAGEEPPLESALDAMSRLVSAGALQPAAPRAVAGQALSGLSAQARGLATPKRAPPRASPPLQRCNLH